jgi:hypothetical protein
MLQISIKWPLAGLSGHGNYESRSLSAIFAENREIKIAT